MNIPNWFARRNIFYGWVIVFACFISVFSAFGVRLSFGIFFDVLTRDNSEFNWTRAQTASVFSTTMIVFALTSTLAGWAFDRFGALRVFVAGALLVGTGLIMTSRMTSLTQFLVYYGIWTGLGITILGLAIQAATISQWFDRLGRRGLAIGLAFSGTGVGILLMAPLVERIITLYNWRMAFLALAGVMLCVNLPILLLLMRDHPQDIGLQPDGHSSKNDEPPKIETETFADGDADAGTGDAGTGAESKEIPRTWTFVQAFRTPLFWMIMFAGRVQSLFVTHDYGSPSRPFR